MDPDNDKETLYTNIKDSTHEGNGMLRDGFTEAAVQQFKKAYDLAVECKNEHLYRACCFNLGAAHIVCGEPATGLTYLREALPVDEEEDEVDKAADLHYNLGVANQMTGNHSDAINSYAQAAKWYKEVDNKEQEAIALEKLAFCYQSTGQPVEACDTFKRVEALYGEQGDTSRQAIILTSMANLYIQMHDIDKCAKALNVLLDIGQELKDCHLQAKIFHEIGLIYSIENCHQSASECFEQALHSLRMTSTDSQDRELQAVILQNLGVTYNNLLDFDKAIKYHQKAVDGFGELGDRKSQSQAFANLAFAQCQSKHHEAASTSFSHAIQASKDSGDKEGQCLATEGLAAAHFRRGNYEQAIKEYKSALSILASAGKADTDQSDRIVMKLSSAVEHQVRFQKEGAKPNTSFDSKRKSPSRRKYGRQRSDKFNRHHSYITKGLASYDTEDESEEREDSEEDSAESMSAETSDFRLRDVNNNIDFSGSHQRQEIADDGEAIYETVDTTIVEPTSANTLRHSNGAHKLRSIESESSGVHGQMVKADREFVLAQIQQDRFRREAAETQLNGTQVKKDKSKVCVIQ